MKKITKLLVAFTIVMTISNNANSQILDFLNKAAETVNRAAETYNNARNTYNDVRETFSSSSSQSNSQPSYRTLTSVRMIAWSGVGTSGTATTRKYADIVLDGDGDKMVMVGSSTYSIYENSSYDSYSSDSRDPSYYKYYTYIDSKKYYFNM